MHNNMSQEQHREGTRSWVWIMLPLIIVLGIFGLKGVMAPDKEGFSDPSALYGVSAVRVPDSMSFAGERMPLEQFDTRESLDRELLVNTYFHSQTLLLIKRSARYFPVIEPILKKYGIPDDFKYLAIAESGLSNAVSPSGAVGFWQFLEGTAREYGLEVNQEVDERYHVEKSTEAACRYFLDSYETYGNWTLVAASYNNGRNGLDQQISIQKQNNYYDLLLNEETARYIFRLAALKLVMEDPGRYGFNYTPEDLYPLIPTYEVTINGPVEDFADFAIGNGTNYKILKFFNPWLRKPYLTNRQGKTYQVKLPEAGARLTRQPADSTVAVMP